jgi:hypothetical protein
MPVCMGAVGYGRSDWNPDFWSSKTQGHQAVNFPYLSDKLCKVCWKLKWWERPRFLSHWGFLDSIIPFEYIGQSLNFDSIWTPKSKLAVSLQQSCLKTWYLVYVRQYTLVTFIFTWILNKMSILRSALESHMGHSHLRQSLIPRGGWKCNFAHRLGKGGSDSLALSAI